MKISTLIQFEAFLKTRIPTRETLFVGDLGLERAKYFMKLLGNPQNKIKVIHIAGTSGKGSTANLMSHILQSQGFNVGLSVSPHVFDIRERMQINNDFPSEKMVLKYFNQILPTILKMESCKFGMPTFFEINVALAYYMFAQEKLDYAVMETGLGGRLDATNTVTSKNKICLITKIGLDHTEILGNTISKIAAEKAGIIQNGNIAISNQSLVTSDRIIKKRCEEKNAELFFVNKKNYSVHSSTPQETVFSFRCVIPEKSGIQPTLKSSTNNTHCDINYGWIPSQAGNDKMALYQKNATAQKWYILEQIKLGLIGIHQAENCSLVLTCLTKLSERDKFKINEKALRKTLANIKIPGRCEIRKIKDQTLIIDGAHNPQKMQAFTTNLARIYPNQKFIFVVAFKKGKDYQNMLSYIIPLADQILLTQFSTSNMDNHWSSIDNKEISKFLKSKGFENFQVIDNKKPIITSIKKTSREPVVITGSLYLIGSIYKSLKK